MGLFGNKKKLDDGLKKTRTGFFGAIRNKLIGSQITDDLYDELEEQLILADGGADTAFQLVEQLRRTVESRHIRTGEEALETLKDLVAEHLAADRPLDLSGHPAVVLVIGVNGVGKTTSIAKLAALYKGQGRKVMLAAGDTFRAAATEQLEVWAGRAGVPIVKAGEGADPAAVIFDAVKSAEARGYDLVICDTAGRLHNKKNLMDEMEKMRRVIDREYPEATVRCLLVVDATTGQNGLAQARAFREAAGINGIVLTKLDGTAKGGIAFSIVRELGVPVMYVGVGEGIEDLQSFSAREFVDALFE